MTDKELYSRAFRLYTSRLWGELLPDDIFAIEFSDGSLGYVSMEDMPPTEFIPGDEHRSRYSMFLYLGENGIRSLLDWAGTSEGDPAAALAGEDGHGPGAAEAARIQADGIIDDAYTHVSQEYLILEYVYREDVSSEDLSDMVTAASMLHLKNRHFQYIPVFSYSKIFRPLERGVEEKYRKYFIEALDTLLYLSEDTDAMRKKFGGKVFYRLYKKDQIPLVKSDGTVSSACWPKAREIRYRGISTDSFGEAALISAVRTDEWDCVVCPLLEAFPDEGEKDEDAYYHMMLFAYSRHLNMPVCMAVLDTPDRERPVISTDGFLDIIAGSSIRPSVIHARDRNTWDILSDMCRKTGIILTMDGDTPGLDEWFSGWMYDEFGDMLDFMDSDDDDIISQREALEIREYIEEVFRYLKQLSNSELKRIPEDLKMLLDKLYDYDQLPDELLVRYERVFGTEDDR